MSTIEIRDGSLGSGINRLQKIDVGFAKDRCGVCKRSMWGLQKIDESARAAARIGFMARLAILFLLAACPSIFARQPVRARHAMVVAQEPTATDVGVRVLKSGGNAVDAAVAVGFALAVTHPFAGNLGGGGFMLIHLADGRTTFIDFRERAPAKASRDMYLDASGTPTRDSLDG